MPNKMKSLFAVTLMISSVAFLTSCNTVKGFGQDMQKGGQAVQNTAERNK